MNPFRKHISLRYIVDKTRYSIYLRMNPESPWLTPGSVEFLDGYLKKTDCGVEFGSGRSTFWFAERVSHLISVESDSNWASSTKNLLFEKGIDNVDYRYTEKVPKELGKQNSEYVIVANHLADESLDFALVDGGARGFVTLSVIGKLKPGGLLIVDNVNWFLPSSSRSPASRSLADGPLSEEWFAVNEKIRNWRRYWTSSGVNDTAMFFKPF